MPELDPLYWHVVRYLVATVFAVACAHKLSSISAFEAVVKDYELLPPTMAPLAARLIILFEISVVTGLASGLWLPWAATLAMLLLALYGAGIGINLARGRRDIDCGCFGPAGGAKKGNTLSGWLLLRNLSLIALTTLLFVSVADRSLTWLDLLTIAAATGAGFAAWSAADQLMANPSRLQRPSP
ncbi:MAG: MauE/DoxX family redox-associated membrane protein [Woeseia sp.]